MQLPSKGAQLFPICDTGDSVFPAQTQIAQKRAVLFEGITSLFSRLRFQARRRGCRPRRFSQKNRPKYSRAHQLPAVSASLSY